MPRAKRLSCQPPNHCGRRSAVERFACGRRLPILAAMIWKMSEATAQRLKAHATRKARLQARSGLSARLAVFPAAFSILSDKAQDEFVAAVQGQPKREEAAFEVAARAIRALRSVATPILPDLVVFVGWSIGDDAAVLIKLSEGIGLLEKDPSFFSPDGCVIASPDGAKGVVFDFDAPPECSPGYLHLFGEAWPPGILVQA